MRIAILADIHANAFALEAVHSDAVGQDVEAYWVLGDVIGYGPHPLPCVQWLQTFVEAEHWVIGNHEAIFAGLLRPDELAAVNEVAWTAIEANRQALAEDLEVLAFCETAFSRPKAEPTCLTLGNREHTLVHSGRVDNLYRYIYPWDKEIFLPLEFAQLHALEKSSGRPQMQWFGHTHVPTLVRARPNGEGTFLIEAEWVEPDRPYKLDGRLTLANPGSVGQPRDDCRRAAYAIFDAAADTVTFRRVAYELARTAGGLNAAGYPGELVARLRDAPLPGNTPPEWRNHFEEIVRRLNCNVPV